MDEFDKILNDYVSNHKKKCLLLNRCEFVVAFDFNFIANIETIFFNYTEISNKNKCLIFVIYYLTAAGYTFCNINQMTDKTISDRCNMALEIYINQPMSMNER